MRRISGITNDVIARFFWLVLFGWVCVLPLAGASLKLDTLKVGSATYSNVTILGANATDLYFSHSQGFANVKLKYVGPELQKRFNYDPKIAEAAEKQKDEDDIIYQSSLARTTAAETNRAGAAKSKTPALGSETGLADPISDRSLLGKPAPVLAVDKWLGDKPSLEGKCVLISFWASWSAPCRAYVPELNALQKKYADKLVIVGVTTESESDLSEMTEPHLEYASGIDSKAKLVAAAGVTSVPYVLLCDAKGIVLYQGHPAALTEKKLQAVLARPSE